MRALMFGTLALVLSAWPLAVRAEGLTLTGNKHWLALASTKDINSAIGIARQYSSSKPRVVKSVNGFFAVVLGPYSGNSVAVVRRLDPNFPDFPKDALLSDGSRYVDTVWEMPPQNAPLIDFTVDKPAHLSTSEFSVELKLEKVGDDQYSTVVRGTEKSGSTFTFTVGDDGEYSAVPAQAGLVQLDANSKTPQIVFTRYSGGAHCCTSTWIVQKPEGAAGWSLVDAGKLDGGGYWFEDIEGEHGLDLLSVDNSFLYAFDSYAGSFAPIKISQLQNGQLVDISENESSRDRLKQDLAGMEFQAKMNPDLWKTNGYLVAWAASKMRLGQGEEAWQTLAENIDNKSGFGPQECKTAQKLEDCPAEQLVAIPILKAAANFLKEGGYGPLPAQAEVLRP
jgi:serine protease Do